MDAWCRLLQHDLLKTVRWARRDAESAGRTLAAADLARLFHGIVDDEGRTIGALARWRQLSAEAPPRLAAHLPAFERALSLALLAAERGAAVAAALDDLERAFAALAAAG